MTSKIFSTTLKGSEVSNLHKIKVSGSQTLDVCPPSMMEKNSGAISPHHLFLASIGACVNLVFETALKRGRVEMIDLESQIHGNYETDEDTKKSQFTSVEIVTTVTVNEGTSEKKLRRLFDIAHENCPIGNCLIGSCVKLITSLNVNFA